MVLLKSSILFSQKVVLNNSDTLICFQPVQAKIILKELNRATYLDTLTTILDKEIVLLNSVNKDLQQVVELKDYQLQLANDLSQLKDIQIGILTEDKERLVKGIKRQKRQKIISIVALSLSTSFMAYLWITK